MIPLNTRVSSPTATSALTRSRSRVGSETRVLSSQNTFNVDVTDFDGSWRRGPSDVKRLTIHGLAYGCLLVTVSRRGQRPREQPRRLARTSHQLSATAGDAQRPAVFSRLGVLDVLSSTPPRPSDRKPHWTWRLAALETKPGEKYGLTIRLSLRLDLGPGVSESHSAVENGKIRGRVRIDAEITLPLELDPVTDLEFRQAWL